MANRLRYNRQFQNGEKTTEVKLHGTLPYGCRMTDKLRRNAELFRFANGQPVARPPHVSRDDDVCASRRPYTYIVKAKDAVER